MNALFGLGANLVASAIAFLFGIFLRSILHYARIVRSRRFWGEGVGSGKAVLCLGSFRGNDLSVDLEVEQFEPTGLIGLGDAKAVHELTALLSKIGIAADMLYEDSPPSGQTKENLILLGTDEVSSLVKLTSETAIMSNLEFRFTDPLTLYDRFTQTDYVGRREMGRLVVDYGRIIRSRNPYNRDRTLVMIGGIYGFATWAGVRLLNDKDFLRRCAALGEI
jgi:hypothetical protein